MTTKQIITSYLSAQRVATAEAERNYVTRVRELLGIMREESFTNIKHVVAGNGATTFSGTAVSRTYDDSDEIGQVAVSWLRDTSTTASRLKLLRPVPSLRCINAILELQQLCEWIEKENLTTAVPYRVGLVK